MSADQIKSVEEYADKLFRELGLDVEFTKHFKERINDPRNNKPINSPFVIEYDPRSKELDLTMKTIMRKKGFETSNDKIIV